MVAAESIARFMSGRPSIEEKERARLSCPREEIEEVRARGGFEKTRIDSDDLRD